jgi:hypothetical protein
MLRITQQWTLTLSAPAAKQGRPSDAACYHCLSHTPHSEAERP